MSDVIKYIPGYCTITISGGDRAKFINIANQKGVVIWDIKIIDSNTVSMKLELAGMKQLRSIARACGCGVSIDGRTGLPFRIQGVINQKILAIGVIIFLFLLYIYSQLILTVSIADKGKIPNVDYDQVHQIVYDNGIKPFAFKFAIDKKTAEKDIVLANDSVQMVNFIEEGSKVEVELIPRKLSMREDESSTDVIAKKAGVIEEILVLRGTKMVERCSYVEKGELLISGVVGGDNELVLNHVPTPAKGKVKARVAYVGRAYCGLKEQVLIPTGQRDSYMTFTYGNSVVKIWGNEEPIFEYYSANRADKVIASGGSPMVLSKVTFIEQQLENRSYKVSEAQKKAYGRALYQVKSKIADGTVIADKKVTPIYDGDKVGYEIILYTIEDIAKERKIS